MTDLEEKTVFSFDELSEQAKDNARCEFRDDPYYLNHEWWDSTYEDAKCCAAILGIDIDEIHFTGFSSQGDGASFDGRYRYKPDAFEKICEHTPQDETLKRLAQEITVLQIEAQLTYGTTFKATCSQRGRYSHSGTIDVEVWPDNDEDIEDYSDIGRLLRDLLRSFADWIYRQLEAEFDYQHSDEVIDGYLVDLSFSSAGERI